jgi:hypothetical protein
MLFCSPRLTALEVWYVATMPVANNETSKCGSSIRDATSNEEAKDLTGGSGGND